MGLVIWKGLLSQLNNKFMHFKCCQTFNRDFSFRTAIICYRFSSSRNRSPPRARIAIKFGQYRLAEKSTIFFSKIVDELMTRSPSPKIEFIRDLDLDQFRLWRIFVFWCCLLTFRLGLTELLNSCCCCCPKPIFWCLFDAQNPAGFPNTSFKGWGQNSSLLTGNIAR